MLICAFSTDWSAEPVLDEDESRIQGKPVPVVPGQHRISHGGTMYYRLTIPYMEVAKHDGYETFLSGTFIPNAPITATLRPTSTGALECLGVDGEWRLPDVIVFQRLMARVAPEFFERAIGDSQVIINDCDDQFWNLPKSNIAYHSTHPDTHPEFNRDHYRKAIAASSAITVTTPEMARELSRLGPPVFLCRNAIDIDRWLPHDPGVDGSTGWIGGVAWRAHDLDVLRPVLPDWLSDWGLSFYHGGNSQDPSVKRAWDLIGIDPEKTKCISADLCPIWEYPKLFEPLNISLIPLEDHRFNWAKSALKALESSAAGIPYIASDLPEQRWFTEDGGMGRLAKNWKPQTWRKHLDELLDPDVRREEGMANRRHAEQWNIADKWTQWRDVLDEVGPRTNALEVRRQQMAAIAEQIAAAQAAAALEEEIDEPGAIGVAPAPA